MRDNKLQSTRKDAIETSENPLTVLVEIMKKVQIDDSEVKLNTATISDGKGGRILL